MTRVRIMQDLAVLKAFFEEQTGGSAPMCLECAIKELAKEQTTKKYERFIPCKCGCNRRETWCGYVDGHSVTTLECKRCGFSVEGRSFADAKRNWNKAVMSNE